MKIQKAAEDAFAMSLSPYEVKIFIKSMTETLRQIPAREYQTRMGAEPDEIKTTIALLEAALK